MIARKNIMEKAAHGSSGVNELKTCEAGLLTSAKKAKSIVSLAAAILFALPIFSDDLFKPVSFSRYYMLPNGTSPTSVQFPVSSSLSEVDSQVFAYLFDHDICFHINILGRFDRPRIPESISSSSMSIDYPLLCTSNSVNTYVGYRFLPRSYSLIYFCGIYYQYNPTSPIFGKRNNYVNVVPRVLVNEVLTTTNNVFIASILGELKHGNELSELNAETLGYILDTLSGYVGPLRSKPFTEQIEAFSKSQGIYSAYIPPEQLQLYKDTYNSLADSDPLAAAHYADSILGSLNSAQSLLNLQRAMSDVWPRTTDALDSLGQHLTDHLNKSVNDGFSMSAHIQGATTNLLQKMTNQTDQIKQDLQAWRTDATNRLERQWDGIKKIRDDTSDISAGVGSIVSDGVKINGPVQVTLGTDNLHVDIANTDLDSLVDGFANGSDAAIQRWLDEWEMFKSDQLPYMGQFSAFIDSNTNLLSSIDRRVDFGFTNTLDSIYDSLTNGLDVSITNELWDYYFDRFKKANEFKDDDGQLFTSIDNQRQLVFGNGFDDAEYKKLDWFSRVELLLYQIGYASTNGTESIEAPDLEGEFDDVSDEIQSAASAFEGAARRVVGVFSLVGGFAQAIKNAFSDIAAPSTDGILLLEGGSWIFEEPLYLRVPVLIQNALRLVFQCVWYLSAFVTGWRLVSFAWGRVASLVRWLWSLIDI